MKWAVAMPSIVAAAALTEAVEAVQAQTRDTEILVVCNGPLVEDACDMLERENGVNIHRPYWNMGCAASWNYSADWAWERGYDRIFLMNDDFILSKPDALEIMERYVEENPNSICHYHGFSGVCLTKDHWDKIGRFDEGFWPAYYEDNDYVSEAKRYGIDDRLFDVGDFKHYKSLSLRISPYLQMLNTRSFPLNKQRYITKWGGPPLEEIFTEPWDGAPPILKPTKELLEESGWNIWYG